MGQSSKLLGFLEIIAHMPHSHVHHTYTRCTNTLCSPSHSPIHKLPTHIHTHTHTITLETCTLTRKYTRSTNALLHIHHNCPFTKPTHPPSPIPHTQPCPPANMDLTLVSASKFVNSCHLATSKDYVIVLTKSSDPTSQPATTKWLL